MTQIKRLVATILLFSALAFPPGALGQTEVFEGRPVFAEGIDLGYYVWREGDKWHVRWTTKGQVRRFTGSVFAEGGELSSLKRIDVEEERRVLYRGRAPHVVVGPRGRAHVRGGRAPVVVEREQDKIEKTENDRRIVFVSKTWDDIDGFDFKVDENVRSLRFMLEIDGKLMPQHVEFGRDNRKATSMPFLVRLGE